jgi:hypothetical protein
MPRAAKTSTSTSSVVGIVSGAPGLAFAHAFPATTLGMASAFDGMSCVVGSFMTSRAENVAAEEN